MKTIYSISLSALALAASLALVSCAKQDAIENGSTSPADGVRTIAVSFANSSTKSTLDGFQPYFAAGDVIKVSNGTTAVDCEVEVDGDKATISTTLTGALTMVYPSTAAKMNGNAIDGILVPTVQDGTFASANICKAEIAAGATSATFENQTAIFKLSVPAKVDEKGVDYVAKSLKVISKNGNIADGSKEIKVGDGTSPVTADENGFYYVSVLPGETASNLYVCAGAGARKLTGDDAIAVNKMYSVALPVLNGHEYVEMTMTVGETTKTYKWATMNIGATTPEDYGHYFAWGETTGHKANSEITGFEDGHSFDWAHNPFNNGSSSINDTYFNAHKSEWLTDENILKPEYDAANVNWGGSWRMPTKAESDALKLITDKAWNATNKGYTFGVSPAQIFLPVAGFGFGTVINGAGNYGSYWSSSLFTEDPYNAFELYFDNGSVNTNDCIGRHCGLSVRPFSK